MAIPGNVLKIFLARAIVIGGVNYLLLSSGGYVPRDLYSNIVVIGAASSAASIASQCYIESMPILAS
jgi:hypothetical protein